MMNFKKSFILSSLIAFFSLSSYASSLDDGINSYKSGNYEKAIELLKKASKDDPENPDPHLWLSKAYEATLEIDKVFPETKLYNELKAKKKSKRKRNSRKE